MLSRFRPHPLLRHPHVQTLWPALMRPLLPLEIRVERLELPDGDFVDLGWSGPDAPGTPIATLVHGLTGGFESQYLRGCARQLIARGWRTVMLRLRGAGPEPNRVLRAYHQGDTADLRQLWRVLRQREPGVRLAAAGWSLGGNILLRALAEEGAAAPVSQAVAACVPLRLTACAERLREGFSRVYQRRLLRELKAMVLRKHARTPLPAAQLARTLAARDFFEYDDAYTAPLNGFADARDYYARCESGAVLHAIRVPTHIIQAADDPFMRPDVLPPASALAASVTLEISAGGGHVGFVAAGPCGRPDFWLERVMAEHLCQAPVAHPD